MRAYERSNMTRPLLPAGFIRGQRGVSRIVVGTDFSLRSEFALARALRLPLGQAGVFSVMHASPPLDGHNGPDGTVPGARCLRKATAAVCRRLRHRVDVDVREVLREGDPVETASEVSAELGAELVVLGRPLVTYPVKELAADSMVRRMVRRLGASVLVVVPHPVRAYARPLVAVDFSRASRRALELALRLCPAPAPVDVLHVVDTRVEEETLRSLGAPPEQWLLLRQERERAAHTALVRFLAPYRETGRELEARVRSGEAPEGILSEAAERGSDLLALAMSGAEARTPLTERVLARAGCDVLVARHAPTVP
ncbi:universal stress protein [Pyxidicoccus fallax]|uniref:Universal stress protein n=1 Tax=Pyxidicoccus fallax TaxID=394095 RepID=A0A848LVY2_9BACT|nr:universal stress protein [Pyxidicoccus fallax]NMO21809.1 universal stress protein [Pyxidicoccus fallax]NPC84288.1 universal stress protein [Pyxidicoccus fallax]